MVDIAVQEGKLVCTFSGRLDSVNCAKWEKNLAEQVAEAKLPVVFDMSKVEYVASGFLRVCLQMSKQVGTENLSLINTCEYVKKVFRLSGFDKHLNID